MSTTDGSNTPDDQREPDDGATRRDAGSVSYKDRNTAEGTRSSADDTRPIDDRSTRRSDTRPVAERGAADPQGRYQDRHTVVAREKDAFGGVKVGAAFFGWLSATGLAVLLAALAAAIGTALGVNANTDLAAATGASSKTVKTVGWSGAIVLLIIIFIAYVCGGYVAGRMARFNGLRQGVMVWIWAVVIAVVIAVIAAIAGHQYDILGTINDFPRIPVQGGVTTWGVITLVVLAIASLIAAMLGGLLGMRYHRRIDKAGLGS